MEFSVLRRRRRRSRCRRHRVDGCPTRPSGRRRCDSRAASGSALRAASACTVGERHLLIAVFRGIDLLIGDLDGNLLDQLSCASMSLSSRRRRPLASADRRSLIQGSDLLFEAFAVRRIRRQRLLPAIVSGQIAAMPLGADVMDVAQQAVRDRATWRCRKECCNCADARRRETCRSPWRRGPSPCTRGRCGPSAFR